MNRTFLIFFLLCFCQVFCQDKSDENYQKAISEVFGKCFKDLNPIEGTINVIPVNKNVKFCSLYQCVSRIGYTSKNEEIEQAILKRAVQITTLLYNEGTPIFLISGMGSFGEAAEKNQNLNDDNNLVYIDIAECITSESLEKIKNIVNKQTLKLINTK
jgi:hypothetical protein